MTDDDLVSQTRFTTEVPLAKKARRTTMRSSAGKKLYAVRNADGSFKDIQTFERAHRADLSKKSRAEKATAKAARKKSAAKSASRKKSAKNRRKTARKT